MMARKKEQMIKAFVILGAVFLLGACASPPEKIVTQTVVQNTMILHPSPPSQLRLGEVRFYVFNQEKLEEFLAKAEANGEQIALFAMSAEGYESLTLNFQEMKRYIRAQKEIILYYRRVIPSQSGAVTPSRN